MVRQKAFAGKLLTCSLAIMIICLLYNDNISVVEAGQYYPYDAPEFTIWSNTHYNQEGDNYFKLQGSAQINPLAVGLEANKRYYLDIYFELGNYSISVGGRAINFQPRYFIEMGGNRTYYESNWIRYYVEDQTEFVMTFGIEWDCYVPVDVGTGGSYSKIDQKIVNFQYNVIEYDSKDDIYNERENELLEEQNKLQEESNTLQEESNKTQKNIFDKITDFFDNFFSRLGDFLLGLIVPSADDLTAFLDEVNAWFSDRLGFIWYPFGFAVDAVSALAGGDANTQFTVPALQINMLGGTYTIWNEMSVDMDAFDIFKYVRLFTSFICVGGIVALAYNKWDEWIGGHGVG